MKIVKKIILMMLIVLLLVPTNSFAATSEESYAGNQLRILGILKGYEDGSLKLDSTIKRAEVAALAVRVLGFEGKVIEGEAITFTDVDNNYWGKQVIENAYKLNIIKGYPDLTFKPLGDITYAEVVAIMVNALGENQELQGEWPQNYISKGKEIGIIPQNSSIDPNKIVTRGEMAVIVWDTLLVLED